MAASTYFAQVQQLYIAYFGRPADPVGQNYWATQIDAANGSIASLIAGFSASTESAALFGNKSTIDKVTAIYQNAFGRAPEPAGLAYWVAQLDSGKVSQAQASWTIQQSAGPGDAAAVQNKLTAAQAFTAQIDTTAEIQGYQGAAAADSARKFLAAVTQDNATATAAVNGAAAAVVAATSVGVVGTTFTLTAGIDNLVGDGGNNVFLADGATSSAADQVNGGSGTDTFKTFDTSAAKLASLTNIEVLEFAGQVANAHLDLSAQTLATTGVAKVVLDDASLLNGKAVTTTAGQTLSLSTAGNVATAGTVTWAASATDTTANLILNGYQGGAAATPVALTVTGAATATQTIASTGAANAVSTLTLAAATTKLVVTGDKALTVATDVISGASATALKTIDASATTGGVSFTLAATENAAFAFTGGSGNDTIKLADNGWGALTAGSQLDGGAGIDKIALLDTALSTAEYTALNAAKNFEVLGLNAALTVDANSLTSLKSFSLDTDAVQSITGMKAGSVVALTAAHAATATLGGAVGVSDVKLDIGTAKTAGLAIAGDLTIGQNAVALTSNGTNAAANVITKLVNADNSVYTITGSNDLTISATKVAVATGSKYDASGLTGKLVIVGNAAGYVANSAKGDVIIGGSNDDTITASTNSSILTGNAGKDIFNVSVAVAGGTANAAVTTITDFTKADKITFGATAGAFTSAKVDLASATTEQAAINLLAAGDNSDVKWGVYNGATYVVDDVDAGSVMAATDTVVKLAGVLDLSTSTFADNTLTFA